MDPSRVTVISDVGHYDLGPFSTNTMKVLLCLETVGTGPTVFLILLYPLLNCASAVLFSRESLLSPPWGKGAKLSEATHRKSVCLVKISKAREDTERITPEREREREGRRAEKHFIGLDTRRQSKSTKCLLTVHKCASTVQRRLVDELGRPRRERRSTCPNILKSSTPRWKNVFLDLKRMKLF